MSRNWDPRVVSRELLDVVRDVQAAASCRLSGGAALSGAHLHHRLSRDLDLFCDSREAVREVLSACEAVAHARGGRLDVVRNAGTFVRAHLSLGDHQVEVDVAHEPSAPLAPRDDIEGVLVDSLDDMHANKITCLLSRAEPRDLVDLYFLDRAGHAPEAFLAKALQKGAGVDPGMLSFLLKDFPVAPLPVMLEPLEESTLAEFRRDLSARFRSAGLPSS
jgi:predicted nucleotidyltransferase component of viral defense system